MAEKSKLRSEREMGHAVENPPGIFRTSMCYDDGLMLCHFHMKKGASVPLHNHEAVQSGYVIKGKLRFLQEGGKDFIAKEGTGYLFRSMESHGAEVLEEAEIIECFSPMRPEYAD